MATLFRNSASQLPRLTRVSHHTSHRSFSLLQRARDVARAAEIHTFESTSLPATPGAKADWGRQFRHAGDAGMIFFPAIALFLGWPLIAAKVLDGQM